MVQALPGLDVGVLGHAERGCPHVQVPVLPALLPLIELVPAALWEDALHHLRGALIDPDHRGLPFLEMDDRKGKRERLAREGAFTRESMS